MAGVKWRVSGRVQGVGFRWFVLQAAVSLDVRGDVCNLPDGRVEIRAWGNDGQLQRLRETVGAGPAGARVDGIEALALDVDPVADGFRVRRH